MAKKKKNIVIVDEELKPTVLANLAPKKISLLGLLLLFVLFGATIFYLPDISNYINAYLKGKTSVNTPVTSNPGSDEEGKNPDTPVTEIEEYPYTADLVIDVDNFSLNNFLITNNELSITIKNNKTTTLNLNDYKYFLHLYNADNTLLQRIMFDDILVSSQGTDTISYSLNDSNIAYFTFYEIKEEDYPSYNLEANDDGEATLVCTKEERTVNYLFKENKLYALEDVILTNTQNPDYANLFLSYQTKMEEYNKINGVESTLELENGVLKFFTAMDLNTLKTTKVNEITYSKDTDAKVVYFELSSKGYNCK